MKQTFFRKNPELLTEKKLLLAVSTGVDSMVLLDLLEQQGANIGVAHVDHQLRPESKAEVDFLREYCEKRSIPFYLKVWEQPAKQNIEAAARAIRYDFFETLMAQENYDLLLTAHHGDDQLETLLMRMTRGGSLGGHAGIARQQKFGTGILLRPLLPFSKEALYQYAKKEQLVYFEDATNTSLDYFRNRIRQKVVPELKKENPQILEHAQQFHQQLTWAEKLIRQALNENLRNIAFDGQRWSFDYENLPEEIGARYYFLSAFFQKIAGQTQLPISQRQLFSLVDQISHSNSQWRIDLGEDWQFSRRYQQFYLEKKEVINDGLFYLAEGEGCELPDGSLITLKKSTNPTQNDLYHVPLPINLKLPLTIRRRKDGDRMRLSKELNKRISRYFIDNKIPSNQRAKAWVVADSDGEIVALLPFVNSYLSITTETDKIHYILDYTLQVLR